MKRRAWDVVVIGGANTDYLIRGATVPEPGQTVEGSEFQMAAGGKGANQAVAAARLGARVAFVGRVGADSRGTELLTQLHAKGVDCRHVLRDRRHATGAALIMVAQDGEKSILTAPGANAHLGLADVRKAARTIINARVLLMQFEAPKPIVLWAARLAHRHGVRIVLDPAPPNYAPGDELLRRIDLIKPNAHEAEALTGIRPHHRASARRVAAELLRRGVKAVSIESGREGNLLVWDGGEEWFPRIRVRSVDATGAGDAYAAGFAVALAEGQPLSAAGAFANAAAALKTTRLGAQAGLPHREAVLALMRRRGRR
jgi:ribokinase